MTLAVIMPAAVSVPAAACALMWIVWYWRRLGGEHVPESRRRIRRASLVVMLVGLPPFVAGLSFIENSTHPDRFAGAWVLVMSMLIIVLVLAFVDILNNLRVHVQESQEDLGEARTHLRRAFREYEKERTGDDTTGGFGGSGGSGGEDAGR